MEDEMQVLKDESSSNEERVHILLTKIETIEIEMKRLEEQLNEEVEERLYLTRQYKVPQHYLQQRNEILQKEVDRTGHLLKAKIRGGGQN